MMNQRRAKFRLSKILISLAMVCGVLHAQAMLVDRGLQQGAAATPELTSAWVQEKGSFVGDDFTTGAAGSVWVLDRLRMWALSDIAAGPRFDKMTLYGGVAGVPIPKEQLECACHSLTAIKSATASGSPDVSIVPVAGFEYREGGVTYGLWQLEFRNLRWSIPGGVPIQFALKAEGARDWFNYAAPIKSSHRLRVFDAEAQLRAYRGGDENGINVQVWGHQSAKAAIHRSGSLIKVVVSGEQAFDVSQVDLASLRLGSSPIGPVSAKVQNAKASGAADLLVSFRSADINLPTGTSVCLAGKRSGDVPFEGCDLLNADSSGNKSR